MSAMFVVALVTTCSGCTTDPVPAEWEAAYQSLDFDAINARDQQVVDCLDEHGFPGFTIVWNGGVESPVLPVDQRDAVKKAMAMCQDEVGGPGIDTTSEEQRVARYHLEIAAAQCLDEHGYTAATSPPTFQRYMELFGTDDHWSAYGAIADQISGASGLSGIGAECPDPGWFAGFLSPAAER